MIVQTCTKRMQMSAYDEAREEQPSPGDAVITPDGEGMVEKIDPGKKVARVKLRENGVVREFPLEEVDRA